MTTDPYRHTCACGEHDLTEVLTRTSDGLTHTAAVCLRTAGGTQ